MVCDNLRKKGPPRIFLIGRQLHRDAFAWVPNEKAKR